MSWTFWQCTRPPLHHQWWGHWQSLTSSSQWDVECHANLWGDPESNPPVVQWQSAWLRLAPSWDLQRGWKGTDWETPSTLPSHMAARQFRKTSRMPPLYIYTSTKETNRPVATTVEYPCSRSQARPWPECCSTSSQPTLSKVSYQRASVASAKIMGLSTWCLLPGSCKRSVRNRTLTCTPPMSIWPRPLTLLVERVCGEPWWSTAAQESSWPSYISFIMACWPVYKTT